MIKNKLLTIFTAFLLVFLSVSFASADFSLSANEATFTKGGIVNPITITNLNDTYLLNVTMSAVTISGDSGYQVTFNPTPSTLTDINSSSLGQFTIAPTIPIDYSKFSLGKVYSANILVKDSQNFSINQTIKINVEKSFCEFGTNETLEITDFNVDNLGEGSDDEWQPLDEIEIKVEVKNTGTDKISNIKVRLMILDDSGKDVTDDFNLEDDRLSLGSLKEGKRSSVTFVIKSLPADLEDEDYRIYVKAYEDGNEDVNCADTASDLSGLNNKYEEISIEKENDNAVIIKEKDISLITSKAGQTVEISFYVYNIGNYDEDEVLVMLENKELGISEKYHLRRLDVGEKQQVTFNVKVPSNANTKTYNLNVYTYFNYDDGDVLQESSYDDNSYDDLDESYSIPLQVTAGVSIEPTITASLLSTAQIGKEFNIQVSITNPGDAGTFVVSLNNYDSWAELVDITPQVLTIGKGETKQATITLKPTQSGQQTFNVKLGYNGKTLEQPVQLNVSEKTGFLTGAFAGFGDSGLYIISAIFLILIIIIVILIVKVSSRPRVSEF